MCDTPMNSIALKVVKSGLGPAIRDSVKAFVTDTDSKMRAVWLWGAPNCGKTMLSGMLAQIFHCAEVRSSTSSKYMTVKDDGKVEV